MFDELNEILLTNCLTIFLKIYLRILCIPLGEVTNAMNNIDINSQKPQTPAVFVPEPPLSRAPSPFLSEEKYKSCHEAWQTQKLAEFNKKHSLNNVKKVCIVIVNR